MTGLSYARETQSSSPKRTYETYEIDEVIRTIGYLPIIGAVVGVPRIITGIAIVIIGAEGMFWNKFCPGKEEKRFEGSKLIFGGTARIIRGTFETYGCGLVLCVYDKYTNGKNRLLSDLIKAFTSRSAMTSPRLSFSQKVGYGVDEITRTIGYFPIVGATVGIPRIITGIAQCIIGTKNIGWDTISSLKEKKPFRVTGLKLIVDGTANITDGTANIIRGIFETSGFGFLLFVFDVCKKDRWTLLPGFR